jgi:hypothetical protein
MKKAPKCFKLKPNKLQEALFALSAQGICPALICNDDGKWACVGDGVQSIPEEGKPLDTSFFIDWEKFCDTPAEAVALFMREVERAENDDMERNANKELHG